MLLFVVSVLAALIVSALCSLAEAVLLSLTPSQVADLSIKNPRVGQVWRSFKTNIERPIAFILILNTSAHTIGASIAGSQFDELWGDEWIWLFSLVFTFAMLQFTEILPKGLGVRFNRKFAPYLAGPLSAMVYVTLPLIKLVHWVNARFNIEKAKPGQPSTTEEIRALASMARLSSGISGLQEYVIRGASRLAQTKIRQVMIPVEQVSFLSTSWCDERCMDCLWVDGVRRYGDRYRQCHRLHGQTDQLPVSVHIDGLFGRRDALRFICRNILQGRGRINRRLWRTSRALDQCGLFLWRDVFDRCDRQSDSIGQEPA
jgi:CBS domain containing-hemolysin-like protein